MDLGFRIRGEGDDDFQVLCEDGEPAFCRGWRLGADGKHGPVPSVLPASEHPLPASLDRLAQEYGLKDELDGPWAVRPLQLLRERGRTMLVLEDPCGEPLARPARRTHGGGWLFAPCDRHRRGPGQGPPTRPRP